MKKFYLLTLLLLLGGCVSKYTEMGVVAPDNVKFTPADISRATMVKNVKGSDSNPILLFIPLGHPKFETAVKQALAKGNGNVLVNAKVKNSSQWFVLFGQNSIEVTGDAVNLPQSAY